MKSAKSAELTDISVPDLKARGWTNALIRDHLGAHDRERPNPRFKSAAPMRLFAIVRVETVEQSEGWAALLEKATRRRASATAAADTKRQALLTAVAALSIDVPRMPLTDVFERACESYNRRQDERRMRRWERGGYECCDEDDAPPACLESDSAFLERIAVNYLRHRLTRYERELEATFGKVGVREAYLAINAKVYDAIGAAYPDLAAECARQLERKRSEHEHAVGMAEAYFADRRTAFEQKHQEEKPAEQIP